MFAGLSSFQASLRADGQQSDRHYFVACLLFAAGSPDEAVESFEAAIAADPFSENAHMDLVLLLDNLKRPIVGPLHRIAINI